MQDSAADERGCMSEEEDDASEVSFDVYVVRDGEPVVGEEVAAHFSYWILPGTVSHEHTDESGHASFSSEHPATPTSVELFVAGESRGTYALDDEDGFTVDLSEDDE
jgi:hypothetical protein